MAVDQYFSKITLPSGETFLVKDSKAREEIESLKKVTASGVSYLGTTTTALTDGATTSPIDIKDGEETKSVAAATGGMVNYNNVMYAWNGTQWDQLGSAGAIKALAYKDSVSATYTPTGTVTGGFQGTEGNISVSGTVATGVNVSAAAPASGETANYTPSGTVTVVPSNTTVKQVSNVGTLPSWSSSVANEILTFSWNQGTLPTTSDKQLLVVLLAHPLLVMVRLLRGIWQMEQLLLQVSLLLRVRLAILSSTVQQLLLNLSSLMSWARDFSSLAFYKERIKWLIKL